MTQYDFDINQHMFCFAGFVGSLWSSYCDHFLSDLYTYGYFCRQRLLKVARPFTVLVE
jgi:hypothetical protein